MRLVLPYQSRSSKIRKDSLTNSMAKRKGDSIVLDRYQIKPRRLNANRRHRARVRSVLSARYQSSFTITCQKHARKETG